MIATCFKMQPANMNIQGYFQVFLSTTIVLEKLEFFKKRNIFFICIFAWVSLDSTMRIVNILNT